MPTFVFGVDYRVEEKRDEIRKVVRVKMGEENVRDLVPVHSGLNEIHQGARAEIQQNSVIRLHQIAGRSAGGMDISAGAENGELHRSHVG